MIADIAFGLFGLAVLLSIGWLFSVNRRAVDWRLVATGVGLQIAFATVVLTGPGMITRVMHRAPWFFLEWMHFVGVLAAGWAVLALLNQLTAGGRSVPLRLAARVLAIAAVVLLLPFLGTAFELLAAGFVKVLGFVAAGSGFVFGALIEPDKFGFVFAFQVLPTIIFFAALMAVLYHLNAMQNVVKGMAWAITRVMRVSGAETTSVCASVFIGQTEAPLTVRPYLAKMTPSELITVMIGGMAHIAGGVLAAYVAMLGGTDDEMRQFYALHLLTASIMAAPATLVVAKVLVPETGEPLTRGQVKMEVEKTTANVIDAAASGAGDGLRLALNVGAMLLAFIALIALINAPLQWLGGVEWFASDFTINGWLTGASATPVTLSLQTIFGYVLAPIAWVIGVPWQDANTVGSLIGQKIVINEFVAYIGLSDVINGRVPGVALTEQGRLIATYALCGFANFSSIAIQIGGIGGLAPERRTDLARFGLRAVLGGTLATFMTATIAGVLSRYA